MHSHLRSLLVLTLVAGGAAACASSDTPVTMMKVTGPPTPAFGRIWATDSTLSYTDVAYSDTASVLARLVPLDSDLSATGLIGPRGGELRIDAAGVRVVFPSGALRTIMPITVIATKGRTVAYDFEPHGTTFWAPVMIEQDIGRTTASVGSLPRIMYGAYYGTSLDSSYVDNARTLVKVRETQLGYVDAATRKIKIFVGHFSGYMVSVGRSKE
jgi:hypothetical protein